MNDIGRNQALKVQKLIENFNILAVFYIPLSRASETMEVATSNLSCDKFFQDLKEGLQEVLDYKKGISDPQISIKFR